MEWDVPHPWEVSAEEGAAIQNQLREQVCLYNNVGTVRSVVGVDVGFCDNGGQARAAAARYGWPQLSLLETHQAYRRVEMPYRSGLLSFRELPAILDVLATLSESPDLVLCDGQGIAHPRRLGIAAHLGVLTGLPTIGVAKSLLLGDHTPVDEERGAETPLYDGEERIGTVLRTRSRTNPVYVSPGHLLDCDAAGHWALACCTRYRLPEPIRTADRLASRGR